MTFKNNPELKAILQSKGRDNLAGLDSFDLKTEDFAIALAAVKSQHPEHSETQAQNRAAYRLLTLTHGSPSVENPGLAHELEAVGKKLDTHSANWSWIKSYLQLRESERVHREHIYRKALIAAFIVIVLLFVGVLVHAAPEPTPEQWATRILAAQYAGVQPVNLVYNTSSNPLYVSCVGGTCSGGGGGTSSTFGMTFPSLGTAAGASDGTNMQPLLVDGSGYLKIDCITGCAGSGGTSSTFGMAFPSTGTAAGFINNSGNMAGGTLDAAGNLKVLFGNTTLAVTNAGTFAVQAAQSGTWNIGTLATITNALPAGTNVIGHVINDASSAVIGHVITDTGSTTAVTGTVTVSGTVTANAGTNLNTSALELDTTGASLNLAQASTTSGQTGPLVQTATTTAAPTYVTAKTNPLSTDTAGNLRVSNLTALPAGSNVIGHVIADSGSTTAVTQATAANLNATVVGAGTAGSPAGGVVSIQGVAGGTAVPVSGTVSASGIFEVAPTTSANTVANPFFHEISDGTNAMGAMANFGTSPTAVKSLNVNSSLFQGTAAVGSGAPLQVTLANTGSNGTNLNVNVAASALSNSTVNETQIGSAAYALGSTVMTGSAPVVEATNQGNPCVNPNAAIQSVFGATSGTALTQIIALSAGKQIFICNATLTSVSGTTPNYGLEYGTATNCGTGTTVIVGAPSATFAAGTVVNFPGNPWIVPASNALCYKNGGTTPVLNYAVTFVQQ